MSSFLNVTNPTDLDSLRSAIASAPRADELVPLGLRLLGISSHATDRISEVVEEELSLAGRGSADAKVIILVDSTMILRSGEDLKTKIESLLSRDFNVEKFVLGNDAHLLANEQALDIATEAIRSADCVVTIGGGTITDIGKVATHRNGDIPLVVVQTAASVDGFTDNVSVILKNGVKRTVPSRWPNAVLADTSTIAGAPMAMNTAGFGEVLSLYTAPADWRLASLFGLDSTFHETPRDLLLAFAGDVSEWANGLADGAPASIEQLTRVLAIRGIGTGVAGTTACLSGVEHVISHMLDMYSGSHGLPIVLHGAQVGVASLIGAAAWELLIERLRGGAPELKFPSDEHLETRVRSAFDWFDPTGEKGTECWAGYSAKLANWRENKPRAVTVMQDWQDYESEFSESLPAPDTLASGLRIAGAPARPEQLGGWVTADVWKWAVLNCLFMRDRFTVVDLLFFCGWWTAEDVDVVIDRAASASVAHGI